MRDEETRAQHGEIRRLLIVPAVLALLFGPAVAEAQPPQPVVKFVFPAGGQRGKTVDAIVSGTGLQGTSAVRVSGEGVSGKVVKVENPNLVRIAVTIDPDAALGERDIRVVTPAGGVSNRYRYFVGDLPEINEKEPNSLKSQAQRLESLPVLINGQIQQSDTDFFRFAAKAGQTLVCEVQARALLPYIADAVPGWVEACLTLYDADGKELTSVGRFRFHPDPVLVYQVPKDGEYLLEIRDLFFRGRDDFVYRLSIGAIPYVTDVFPLGGPRNSDVEVELRGANLPVKSTKLVLPGDGSPLRMLSLSQNGLRSNVLPFAVGDHRETREAGPNHSFDRASKIDVPVTINGRIQQSGEAHYFRFAVKKGQRFIMEVQARRLGSPLDSILTLFNSQGAQLAEEDDADMGEPLLTHHADSRLDYTFPSDGDYVLRIRDAQGRGGEAYAYRLHIIPPRPDFILRTVPDDPRLGPADTAVVTVKALRMDGFNDAIDLAVQNLPTGFVASKAIIPAGQSETRLTITAPGNAPVALWSPIIVGAATLGGAPVVRQAVGAEDIMQAFSLRHDVPTKGFLVAVYESADFTLSSNIPSTEVRDVRQESQLHVVVKVSRKGLEAEVAQAEAARKNAEGTLAGLHGQVTAAAKAHEAAEKAAKDAEAAAAAAKAAADKARQTQVAAEKRKLANEAKAKHDKLAADEKAAAGALEQAKKNLEAIKQKAKQPINLSADPLPGGVTFAAASIAADKNEAAVTFGVTPQAPLGLRQNIVITGTMGAGEATVIHVAPAIPIKVIESVKALQAAAATKRQQASAAKKKLDELVEKHEKPAEAGLAAAAKVATDAAAAKAAADKALAQAKDAVAKAQKSQQQAQVQSDAAAKKLAEAEAQKKAAEQALTGVKNQVSAASAAYQQAEAAAKEAELAVAKAKP